MRLADFILANPEPILAEWEAFARTVTPNANMDRPALRDHAAEILRCTARDMASAQTPAQQRDKSEGKDAGGDEARLDGASDVHAAQRVDYGFDMAEVVAEYRALRASVLRLWLRSGPAAEDCGLDDVTRFNESIDQSLAAAVAGYSRRVDRSRQMFLAILGHDLRGPLNAIALSSAVLKRACGPDAAETAAQIADSTDAMARMITDMLDFTTASLGGRMPVCPAPMDLKELCESVADETRAAHPDRPLRFEAHGDLAGEWDAARLRQVISNLLGNAMQHGTGPVDLTARARARAGEGAGDADVVLTVRNGGKPIPPDVLPTLFDPLVRGTSDASPKARRPGSIGLGLYIAREIVAAHGGTIDVTSSAAEGTAFTVRLPRHRRPAPDHG